MQFKNVIKILIFTGSVLILNNAMASLNDSKENLLILFSSGGTDQESAKKVSLDAQRLHSNINNKNCKKEDIIYLSKTVKNQKYVELCRWGKEVYRYKYGKVDNPEIILFSNDVTKEEIALGGFSFIGNGFEYSVVEDNYKATLTVYKGEDALTNIYLNIKTKEHINKTLATLPEKIY